MTGHQPDLTTWDCLSCGKPWACDSAREALVAEMDVQGLGLYMATRLFEAAGAMPFCPPAELHERFLAWVRPGPAS